MERENLYSNNENNIEWIKGSNTTTCSFSQGRYISKMKKLADKYPDECQIMAENKDGSIVAHFPVSWIKINRAKIELTDEQREERAERARRNFHNA